MTEKTYTPEEMIAAASMTLKLENTIENLPMILSQLTMLLVMLARANGYSFPQVSRLIGDAWESMDEKESNDDDT